MPSSFQLAKCLWCAIAFSYVVQGYNRKVFFDVISIPIIFGDSVVLRCYVSEHNCDKTARKSWRIGPQKRLICSNGMSYEKEKYKMVSNNSGASFDLKILNFNSKDMGNVYTCSCGFNFSTNSLIQKNYIKYPSSISASTVLIYKGMVIGSVRMEKVFPIPSCTVICGEIHQNVVFYTYDAFANLTYTEISANYTINAEEETCDITVTVVCRLGENTFKETRKTNNNVHCKSTFMIPVLIATGVVITIVPVSLITLYYGCDTDVSKLKSFNTFNSTILLTSFARVNNIASDFTAIPFWVKIYFGLISHLSIQIHTTEVLTSKSKIC